MSIATVRAGKVTFHTPQQQHGFNFPYQIGSADSMSDHPSSAQRFEVSEALGGGMARAAVMAHGVLVCMHAVVGSERPTHSSLLSSNMPWHAQIGRQ